MFIQKEENAKQWENVFVVSNNKNSITGIVLSSG